MANFGDSKHPQLSGFIISERRQAGGQSVILPVKLGNQSDKSKESSQSAKGYS